MTPLANEVNRRIRPRCESLIGLQAILADDIAAMQSVDTSAMQPTDVIDDGQGVIPFTKQSWDDYATLIQSSTALGEDANVQTLFAAAKVRPIDLIISNLSRSSTSELTGAAKVLAERIRPRAELLRGVRYRLTNDSRILSVLIEGMDPADVIDDGRAAEEVSPLTVGLVQVFIGVVDSLTGATVNTDGAANAIDAACLNPLEA